MRLSDARRAVLSEKEAFLAIMSQLWDLAKANPKKAILLIILELYAHSLIFHHLQEMKDVFDLIPFYHAH